MSFLSKIFGRGRERQALLPLYSAIVAAGRDPAWYVEGQVPDTIDGRFDMLAALLALVLLRLEAEGPATSADSALLAETFVEDMDGSLRQIGIGDLMVGKHVGKMMGALGGRLSSFRTAAAAGAGLEGAVIRNIFHDAPPSDAVVAFVAARLSGFAAALEAVPAEALLRGAVPQL